MHVSELVKASLALFATASLVTLQLAFYESPAPRPAASQPALRYAAGARGVEELSEEQYEEEFASFVLQFNKTYKSEHERAKRFAAFKANLKYIREANAKGGAYSLGVNSKSDMSHDEFTARYLPLTGTSLPQLMAFVGAEDLESFDHAAAKKKDGLLALGAPKEIDWRKKGCVTGVREQGQCGSCWSFSAMGALEGAVCVASKKPPVELSVQQMVDCSRGHEGQQGGSLQGCHGGIPHVGFEWIMKSKGGVCSWEDYPYVGKEQKCQKKCKPALTGIHKWHAVKPNDEAALMEVLSMVGPISIVLNASSKDFKLLKGGVFNAECDTDPNHAVLLVGYGSDPKAGDYWLIKNSWGEDWGDKGYGKIARGGPEEGVCGILSLSVFAVMKEGIIDDGSKRPRPTKKPRKRDEDKDEEKDEDEDKKDKRRRRKDKKDKRDKRDKRRDRDYDADEDDDEEIDLDDFDDGDDSDFKAGAWEINYDLPDIFVGDE